MRISQIQTLKRELGLFGAIVMGLGSVIGAGLFVSLGIAVGVAGSGVVLAIVLAGLLAICSGLSSAQLAASHPVSGEAYEYGYRYLSPWLGFTGGWLYLISKIASAATAALGFAGYLLSDTQLANPVATILVAEVAVITLTLIVLRGIRNSTVTSVIILTITLISLAFFSISGLLVWPVDGFEHLSLTDFWASGHPIGRILQASALMFIAYAGGGRIATMGEEAVNPKKNIPRSIIATVGITILLYVVVATVGIGTVGAQSFSETSAQGGTALEFVAQRFSVPGAAQLLIVGATAAMLNVLLNLILGLSRVLLAMGRRNDMPTFITKLNPSGTTPYWSVIAISVAIFLLVLTGNIETTWSFSAFSGLTRTAIVNLAALKMEPENRLYPVSVSWIGLFSCVFLAFWVEWQIWLSGFLLIGLGLIWHLVAQSFVAEASNPEGWEPN